MDEELQEVVEVVEYEDAQQLAEDAAASALADAGVGAEDVAQDAAESAAQEVAGQVGETVANAVAENNGKMAEQVTDSVVQALQEANVTTQEIAITSEQYDVLVQHMAASNALVLCTLLFACVLVGTQLFESFRARWY